MVMHKMLLSHDPENGVWGDCHRTAIAALLGLHPSEVPHFYAEGNAKPPAVIDAEINDWLRTNFGLRQVNVPFHGSLGLQAVLDTVEATSPGSWYLIGGMSRFGVGHTVVGAGGRIEFDPSPVASGIIGPMEDGHYWITFLATDRRVPAYNLPGALSENDKRLQAARCACRGADDLCPCQNVPDRATQQRWRASAGDGSEAAREAKE